MSHCYIFSCSQSLAIINNTVMNIREINNLIPRILTLFWVVYVFKICRQVLLWRETRIAPTIRTTRVPAGTWLKFHFFQEVFFWPDHSNVPSLSTKCSDLLLNSSVLSLALKKAWPGLCHVSLVLPIIPKAARRQRSHWVLCSPETMAHVICTQSIFVELFHLKAWGELEG